jgi:hypothetical protein
MMPVKNHEKIVYEPFLAIGRERGHRINENEYLLKISTQIENEILLIFIRSLNLIINIELQHLRMGNDSDMYWIHIQE